MVHSLNHSLIPTKRLVGGGVNLASPDDVTSCDMYNVALEAINLLCGRALTHVQAIDLDRVLQAPLARLRGTHFRLTGLSVLNMGGKNAEVRFMCHSHAPAPGYGCTVEDLAVALLSVYEKRQAPSFSLDPWDAEKPQGPYFRKVYYPDERMGPTIQATPFGDTMFTADWLLKQLRFVSRSLSFPLFHCCLLIFPHT